MKKALIILFFAGIFGCHDGSVQVAPELVGTRAIEFRTDSSKNYTLYRTWYLVGLKNINAHQIEYPPCGSEVFGDKSGVTLLFDSTEHNLSKSIYPLPFLFSGMAPINGYSGSYDLDNESISTGQIIHTLKGGTKEFLAYEEKYLDALSNATTFNIEYNILTIDFEDNDNPGLKRSALFIARNESSND